MGVVFLIVVGGTLGWLAAIVMRAESGPEMLRNGVAGVAGALLAGLGVSPLLGQGSLLYDAYDVAALVISLLGSAALLLAVNLPRLREQR